MQSLNSHGRNLLAVGLVSMVVATLTVSNSALAQNGKTKKFGLEGSELLTYSQKSVVFG